jgi:hypothetical protein
MKEQATAAEDLKIDNTDTMHKNRASAAAAAEALFL